MRPLKKSGAVFGPLLLWKVVEWPVYRTGDFFALTLGQKDGGIVCKDIF